MKPKVVVIVGPTASGKTALSVKLAKKIDGEIISSDSMQVYKDMNIGTAKVTEEEKEGIEHYLVDFVSPCERYTVSDFKNDAEAAINKIIEKNKMPIIVGGTGLYVNSIIYNIKYTDMEFDEDYRNMLMDIAKTEEGLENLYKKAIEIDEKAAKAISKNDKKRIVRILEIYKATGKTKTALEEESRKIDSPYEFYLFGINIDREKLYEKINKRVDLMMQKGLVEEVKMLLDKYDSFPTAMQGLGYKEVKEYLDGKISYDDMVEKIKQESRRYAKRQMTWFRRNDGIIWLDGNNSIDENVDIIIKNIGWGFEKKKYF